jgi:beta-lactamase class A
MKPYWNRSLVLALTVISSCTSGDPSTTNKYSSLQERVEKHLSSLNAQTTFYAKHLPSGKEISIRADQPMNPLSVIKVPMMVLAFRDVENGLLDLDQRYSVKLEDMRDGSGLLQTFTPGLTPTFKDLLTQMIITSDNTATDIILNKLGMDRVNTFLREEGYLETTILSSTGDLFRNLRAYSNPSAKDFSDREIFERKSPLDSDSFDHAFRFEGDSTKWLGRTTAREMGKLLEQLGNAELTSRESAKEMTAILKKQMYSSRIPRFLRGKAIIAHKTGDWPPHAGNDVGILYYEGGPSIISVFTNQNRGDFVELEATIGRIAEDLINTWN